MLIEKGLEFTCQENNQRRSIMSQLTGTSAHNSGKFSWIGEEGRKDFIIIGLFSMVALILHLVAIEGFGYFRDELYYFSCSNHLAFGYVDHPPLSILLLKFIRWVLGDSLLAIRLLPAVMAAVFVFFTGIIARELGGKRFALALASVSSLATSGNFFIFSVYSMNFLNLIFWQVCIYIVLRIIKDKKPEYWIYFGIAAGLGLQNKVSILFLGVGLLVGLVATGEREYFKSRYLWLGGTIAGLLFLPYILWNLFHGFPTLEFIQNAKLLKMARISPLDFFLGQIIYNNPVTFLVWMIGLGYFFFNQKGKQFKLFGWMYLSIYLLFTLQQAKDYYLAGIYPILFAAGAIQVEIWLKSTKIKGIKALLILGMLLPTLFLCPVTLPILPVETTAAFSKKLGLVKSSENHEMGVLPQHFADMQGWEAMVEKVAKVYHTLSEEEKKECLIFATNYGVTGALNFFGKNHGLPPAFSGHNNHFFWPPKDFFGKVVIIVGGDEEGHHKNFEQVTQADRTHCQYCMPYENNKPIFICRGFKYSLKEIWPTVKKFI
jgi:4-amino-4-deoxy-L-arabinose transferase-like glycosyltransferase